MDSKKMGKLGGLARARKLSAKRRREIAIKAARASVKARKNGKPNQPSRSKNGS